MTDATPTSNDQRGDPLSALQLVRMSNGWRYLAKETQELIDGVIAHMKQLQYDLEMAHGPSGPRNIQRYTMRIVGDSIEAVKHPYGPWVAYGASSLSGTPAVETPQRSNDLVSMHARAFIEELHGYVTATKDQQAYSRVLCKIETALEGRTWQERESECQALWRTNVTLVCQLPKGHAGDHRCGRYSYNGEVDIKAASAHETQPLQRALQIIDAAGALSDWINRARPVIADLMQAYERRIRTDCTPEQLTKEPWRCMEYIGAESLLRDQPKAVVELTLAEKASSNAESNDGR